MGVDIYIGPSSGFYDWDDNEWTKFWNDPEIDGKKLGSWTAVSETIDTVITNLVKIKPLSRYNTFLKITIKGFRGWYNYELPKLQKEVYQIKNRLQRLPLDKQRRVIINVDNDKASFEFYKGEYLEGLKKEFHRYYPDITLNNLYDLNHQILNTLENYINKAIKYGKGIVFSG